MVKRGSMPLGPTGLDYVIGTWNQIGSLAVKIHNFDGSPQSFPMSIAAKTVPLALLIDVARRGPANDFRKNT